MNRDLLILAIGVVALLVYHDMSGKPASVNAGTVGTTEKVPESATSGSEQVYGDPAKSSGLAKIMEQLQRQVAALPGAGK